MLLEYHKTSWIMIIIISNIFWRHGRWLLINYEKILTIILAVGTGEGQLQFCRGKETQCNTHDWCFSTWLIFNSTNMANFYLFRQALTHAHLKNFNSLDILFFRSKYKNIHINVTLLNAFPDFLKERLKMHSDPY